ncbi:dimethylsulfone monooxygenase SfnG [Streptomyces olivaceus]|uniref:dimethylsulfone monooxygenase SfnG n=2 Tax=Streptomyces olivaceus TaxID=47716 RepID=UPI001CCB9AA3|nr:dimethyl sulfone monooxygenase SfnG [Streptomyces olivaceus]
MSAAPAKFAYWVPNVSGGLVTSKIEQRTDWGYEYNRELAVLAENNGFEYALSQVRYMASYGAEFQHESTGFSLALLLATERLKVIAAVHPGLWHPGVLAKFGATADHLSGGRFAVNVVSGWFKGEFTALGEPWLEHDERYRRSEEFIRALRQIWTEDHTELAGDFYRLRDFSLKPKPLNTPERPHPEIFQGGNSTAARAMAGRVSDWYFSNGKDFDGVVEQLADVRAAADLAGRTPPKFALNGFLIARDTWGLSSHSRLPGDAMHALSPHRAPTTYNQYAGRRPARREHAPDAAGPALRADDGNVTTGPRPRPRTPCARSSRRPTPMPSRASAQPSSRRGGPPRTRRACGRTPASRTSSSTTTASAPG